MLLSGVSVKQAAVLMEEDTRFMGTGQKYINVSDRCVPEFCTFKMEYSKNNSM